MLMLASNMSNLCKSVIINDKRLVVLLFILLVNGFIHQIFASNGNNDNQRNQPANENSIEYEMGQPGIEEVATRGDHRHIPCGTIASNITKIVVKNPHHPEATYIKAICETVIERKDPQVKRLTVRFKKFQLYRPNYDGYCMHDRFGVYNDLNVAISPIICGNYTGKNITIPFVAPQTSLIVSITTSDLDHDRYWHLEIEQER